MKEKIMQRKKEIIIGVIVCLVAVVLVSFLIPKKANVDDLFNKLKSQPEVSSRIKDHTLQDSENVPSVSFQDEAFGEDNDALILLCSNEQHAEVFQYYYETISKQEQEIRDKEEYGHYFKEVNRLDGWIGYIYKVDNCVMYIPIAAGDEVAALYQKAFETTIKDLNFDIKDDAIDVEAAKKEIQSDIDDNVKNYKDAVDESISDFITSGDKQITTLKTSKNETSLKEFKEKYLKVDAPIFKDRVSQWSKDIKSIEDQIAEEKKKAEEEKKKAEERAKNTHGAGTYKVGTDISAGEYYISGNGYFSVNKNGSGDLSSIIVNGNFKNNSIITVTDGQYLTVQRATFMPLKYAPEPNTSQEGMFKVGTHLKAGEYKLKTTSSSAGYYAVYSSSKQGLSHIVKNSNFNGSAYVTVKNGQYLVLSRCSIDK